MHSIQGRSKQERASPFGHDKSFRSREQFVYVMLVLLAANWHNDDVTNSEWVWSQSGIWREEDARGKEMRVVRVVDRCLGSTYL